MQSRIERICADKGLKMTDQRRTIAQVLSESVDHPDVDQVYQRATELDPRISIATVYRTVRLFQEANILEKHDFGDGRARYEEVSSDQHYHLINIKTGEVLEFYNSEIVVLKEKIAKELGYDLVDHRLELYATPLPANDKDVPS